MIYENLIIRYCTEHYVPEDENEEFIGYEKLTGEIRWYDESGKSYVKIGNVTLFMLHVEYASPNLNCVESLIQDSNLNYHFPFFNEDSMSLKAEIENEIGDSWSKNILIAESMVLFPEYRSKGLGGRVLLSIEQYFTSKCGLILFKSFPRQLEKVGLSEATYNQEELYKLEQNEVLAKKQLNQFYLKCSYHLVEYRNESYFIKNLQPD